MNARWILCLLVAGGGLLVAGGVASAGTAQDDLKFAQQLGLRGLDKMADTVLSGMIASRDPDKQRAGRFGKALITKQQAQIAATRFVRVLESGATEVVTRVEVLKLFEDAIPEIEAYVKTQGPGSESAFLLAETLVESAEFLVGSRYPERLKEQRAALVTENKKRAEALFQQAMDHYRAVVKATRDSVKGKVERDTQGRALQRSLRRCRGDSRYVPQ